MTIFIHIKKYTLPLARELKNKMLLVKQSLYSLNYFRKKKKKKTQIHEKAQTHMLYIHNNFNLFSSVVNFTIL